ncbi:MAG: lipoyl(octanoyl) transferase LipB [Phycisphaeraceae bacterium]|nr:lipoyl(octanoyl) transferase LipB [Phycisphaeraceae bacterium]
MSDELANSDVEGFLPVVDLGRMDYESALQRQLDAHARVLAERDAGSVAVGRLLLVEHDPPVITVSNRPTAAANLIATPEALARHGVTVANTDRGGDVTYHGPGQLVTYPIVDLNRLRLPLHTYIRLLEGAIVDVVEGLGHRAGVRPSATGVWVWRDGEGQELPRKIAAIGVRVRRWVTLHGLALNVTTNLEHFGLIVPCGLTGELAGGGVTSLEREAAARGTAVPGMAEVRTRLVSALRRRLMEHQRAWMDAARS